MLGIKKEGKKGKKGENNIKNKEKISKKNLKKEEKKEEKENKDIVTTEDRIEEIKEEQKNENDIKKEEKKYEEDEEEEEKENENDIKKEQKKEEIDIKKEIKKYEEDEEEEEKNNENDIKKEEKKYEEDEEKEDIKEEIDDKKKVKKIKNDVKKEKKNKEKKGIIKTIFSIILKVFKWIGIGITSIIVLVLVIGMIGKSINKRVPDGGINTSMYVNINGSKQWISIYGKNINNPVILYLHGGPGEFTSYIDYAFLRKWSDVYTVVSWDQRDAGLSSDKEQLKKDIPYTHKLFMKDGLEMTKFLLNYLHKDKIILIGHSWGSSFGTNLILKYPEYYQYYIGTGQLIDMKKNEEAFLEAAKEWSKGDEEGEKLVASLDINNRTMDYYLTRNQVMQRYGYHGLAEKVDYNVFFTLLFNPYYSYWQLLKVIFAPGDLTKYMNFLSSDEFDNFSLLNRTEYQIPFYNILGDHDYQTNHFQAEDYFNRVKAPRKKLFIMKNMNHGLLEVRSGEFSDIMHKIAKLEQTN